MTRTDRYVGYPKRICRSPSSPSPDKLVQEGACDERARGLEARRIDAEFKVRRVPLALLVSFGVLAADLVAANAAEDLPRLGVTLPATSVSGLSSGAYMAGQIEVAHSVGGIPPLRHIGGIAVGEPGGL